jgi:hypothetical protein
VIEVIWSSGELDKLEIYRRLGVREAWIWEDGVLTAYALRGERYQKIAKSAVLPGIDLVQLASFVTAAEPASKIVRAYRRALARSRKRRPKQLSHRRQRR